MDLYSRGPFVLDLLGLIPFHWIMPNSFTPKYLGFKLFRISQIFRKSGSLLETIKSVEYLFRRLLANTVAVSFSVSKVIL
jgi:hypothetical protein